MGALFYLVLGLFGLALVVNALQFVWNSKVKSGCTCGAATGRWFRWYDKPVNLGARWYAERNYPRRWNDSDFAKFSKLGRSGREPK